MASASMDPSMPIVLDTGSGFCKAGYAGDSLPRAVFPSVVGRLMPPQAPVRGAASKECLVGNAALKRRDTLSLRHPINHGFITNWDDTEKIWHHAFYDQMDAKPEEHPVLLAEPLFNPPRTREDVAQVMFETFNVPALCLKPQVVLAAHDTGRISCLCLEIGDSATHVVAVIEGQTSPRSVDKVNLAGRDITSYLAGLLGDRGYSFTTTAELQTVREMKEKLCYAALNFDKEKAAVSSGSKSIDETYTLPDGKHITVGKERFICSEILFQPTLIGREIQGLHEMVFDCVMKCPAAVRSTLFQNVVISGGTSMCQGLQDRLRKQLHSMNSFAVMPSFIIAYPERMYSVWNGGSVVACLSTFRDMCVSKQDYQESGSKIINRKCRECPKAKPCKIVPPE